MKEADSTSPTGSKMPWMDAMFYNLAIALNTPEGEQLLSDVESLMQRIQSRREVESVPDIPLTPNEEKALAFIRSEHKQGRSPGVRKIAQAVGLRSSRSGARLIRSLKAKGFM